MSAPDTTTQVMGDLSRRHRTGLKKYGVTLANANLSQRALLQHAYEEALDLACYLRTLMTQMDREAPAP